MTNQERRESERKKISLHKTFNCELHLQGEVKNCFIYIEDISATGMQVHSDFSFPGDIEFSLIIRADEALNLTVKKIWQKELLGGVYITGMEFSNITNETREKLERFTDRFSPEGKRKSYRLNKVLAIEMTIGEEKKKFYALTQNLSGKGMRIMHDDPIPKDTNIDLRILLSFDDPPVNIKTRIAWTKKTQFDNYLIGMEFSEISEEDTKKIRAFVDKNFINDEKEKEEKQKEHTKSLQILDNF
ncbi:MAG: PilZ domain-containing protein [Armatimonadota bacterium]